MVKCVVETTGLEHCERMFEYLEKKGYPLLRNT